MFNPVYWNLITQTSPITKNIYGVILTIEFNEYKSGRVRSIFLKNDWERVCNHIAKNMLNKIYFDNIKKEIEKGAEETKKFLKEIKKINLSKLNFDELISLSKKIQKIWLIYDIPNVYSWFIGGDKFKEIVNNKLNLPNDIFLFLTTPIEKTFVSRLEFDLLKYTKLIKQNKHNLEEVAKKLSDDYCWIPFGYDGLEYWTREYFIKKLKNNVKNYSKKVDEELKKIEREDKENLIKRKKNYKKFKLNKKELELINRINTLAVWTDERKNLEYRLYYYYSQILLELGKMFNISYKNLKFLFTEELSELEDNRDELLKRSDWRINNDFIIKASLGKIKMINEDEKNEIMKELEQQLDISQLKGFVASKGKKSIYKGIAKIVLSAKDGAKVKKGDFLIATMTTPDYVTTMGIAEVFITDEGGVTCHAAIVAREMNKPCIIGTKIATKVLKDGDLVEVDTDKGIVKVIKRG